MIGVIVAAVAITAVVFDEWKNKGNEVTRGMVAIAIGVVQASWFAIPLICAVAICMSDWGDKVILKPKKDKSDEKADNQD